MRVSDITLTPLPAYWTFQLQTISVHYQMIENSLSNIIFVHWSCSWIQIDFLFKLKGKYFTYIPTQSFTTIFKTNFRFIKQTNKNKPIHIKILYFQNTKNKTAVKLTAVSCAPVVEVKIKRPDTKYQLGFSVQNGVVSPFFVNSWNHKFVKLCRE